MRRQGTSLRRTSWQIDPVEQLWCQRNRPNDQRDVTGKVTSAIDDIRMDRQCLDDRRVVEGVNLWIDGEADRLNRLVVRPSPVQVDEVRHTSDADLRVGRNRSQMLVSHLEMGWLAASHQPG